MSGTKSQRRIGDPGPASGFKLQFGEKTVFLKDYSEKKGAAEITQIGVILGETREQIGGKIEQWLLERRSLFKWLGKD
jgi:hypothetical protein